MSQSPTFERGVLKRGPAILRQRQLRITPKGHAILRAVERGTYKFAPGRKIKKRRRAR